MADSITTDITWTDLQAELDAELAELREAYEELRALAIEDYDETALDRRLPQDLDLIDEADRDLFVYQQQLEQYDEAAKTIQKRQHLFEDLAETYGEEPFEIKMLTGEETVDIETELRMLAAQRDVSVGRIQIRRNALTVDAATVDAPAGVPRDDDGSPTPSECPNALVLQLWEQIQRFNQSGSVDFRAEGFGAATQDPSPLSVPSATPSVSEPSSDDSGPTDE